MGSLPTDGGCGAPVTLVGHEELDATAVVSVVGAVHERHHPFTCLVFAGVRSVWVVGPALVRAEKGFRVGVVVADPMPRERLQGMRL